MPETIPMEKILGPEVGKFICRLHEENGVAFHLGTTATSIDERSVTLKNGENLQADLVVVGIGVRPAISLAERAGLAVDRGVTVDEYLKTSVRGSSQPATSHAGRTGSPANESASNILSWPSARGRPRHATSLAARRDSTPSRSSGPNNTILASPMSGTPNDGTKRRRERLCDNVSTRG